MVLVFIIHHSGPPKHGFLVFVLTLALVSQIGHVFVDHGGFELLEFGFVLRWMKLGFHVVFDVRRACRSAVGVFSRRIQLALSRFANEKTNLPSAMQLELGLAHEKSTNN